MSKIKIHEPALAFRSGTNQTFCDCLHCDDWRRKELREKTERLLQDFSRLPTQPSIHANLADNDTDEGPATRDYGPKDPKNT